MRERGTERERETKEDRQRARTIQPSKFQPVDMENRSDSHEVEDDT